MSTVESPRKRKNEARKQLLKDVKQKDKEKGQRHRTTAKKAGLCGARTRQGGVCQKPAGWGTPHAGFGVCRHHGGALPSHNASHYRSQAIFMGAEKDINPFDAIMWCIRIKAGEIEWLSEKMKELEEQDWVEESIFGKQMHLWQRERTAAIELLAKISKDAVSLGIAERAVRLAESYGASIARLLKGIHDDLELTQAQKNMWPQIVRRQLVLIESTQSLSPVGPERQIEAPK